jgi:hypothetical protein
MTEKNKVNSILLGLLLSLAMYLYGIWEFYENKIDYINSWSPLNLIIFLVIVSIFSNLINKIILKKNLIYGCLLALGITSIAFTQVISLVMVLFFAYSALRAGNLITENLLNLKNHCNLIKFGLGCVLYGLIANFLALLPINFFQLYFLICLIPIAIYHYKIDNFKFNISITNKGNNNNNTNTDTNSNININNFSELLLLIIATFILLVYFAVASMPEIGHDALASHLYLSNYLWYNGKWHFDFEMLTGAGGYLGNWLYAFIYILGGESSVRLLNLIFIVCISLMSVKLLRIFINSRKADIVIFILILSTPIFFLEASSLYIDSIWCFLLLAVIYLILTFNIINVSTSVIVGALLGGALSAKLITLLSLPILVLIYIYSYINNNINYKIFIKNVFVIIIFAIIFSSGTLLITYIFTGNPVFPFYNNIFKSSLFPIENFNNPIYNSKITFTTLYDITFNSNKFLESRKGAVGFSLILFFIPITIYSIITKDKKFKILYLIAFVSFVTVFFIQSYLRYILPTLVIFNVLTICMIYKLCVKKNKFAFLLKSTVVILIVSNLFFLKSAGHYGHLNNEALLSQKGRDNYIYSISPIRFAVDLVNILNVKDNFNVLFYSEPFASKLNHNALYVNWYNQKLSNQLNKVNNLEEMSILYKDNNIKYIILNDKFGSPFVRGSIIASSKLIKSFDGIEVREIVNKSGHHEEILLNGDLKNLSNWNRSIPIVSDSYPLQTGQGIIYNQVVTLEPGKSYEATVSASCDNDNAAQGRVQVNLLNIKNKIIASEIHVFKCKDSIDYYSKKFNVPKDAVVGIFYLNSHDNKNILFYNASLIKIN